MARPSTVARLLFLLMTAASCLTTSGPQPDPPTDSWRDGEPSHADASAGCSAGPDNEDGGWRPSFLGASAAGTTGLERIVLVGTDGAVRPARLEVSVRNLETTDAPQVVSPFPDGSFEVALAGELGDEFRLVAQGEGVHSPPRDVVVDEAADPRCEPLPSGSAGCVGIFAREECWARGGCYWREALRAPTRQVPECVRFGPRQWMSYGDVPVDTEQSHGFHVYNDTCEQPVVFELSMRGEAEAFDLEPGGRSVSQGDSLSIAVTFAPQVEGEQQAVFFVTFTSPDIGRWPVSLWGVGWPE